MGFWRKRALFGGCRAYDDVIQAASGMASFACMVDGDPRPRYVALDDRGYKWPGCMRPQASLAAYVHRLRTGQGQHVQVPMFECFTQFLYEEHLYGATFDPPHRPDWLYAADRSAPGSPYPTSDGPYQHRALYGWQLG